MKIKITNNSAQSFDWYYPRPKEPNLRRWTIPPNSSIEVEEDWTEERLAETSTSYFVTSGILSFEEIKPEAGA